jgi:hypothetical protein
MREIRQSGSEGGEAELNRPSLPLSEAGVQTSFRLSSGGGDDGGATDMRTARPGG